MKTVDIDITPLVEFIYDKMSVLPTEKHDILTTELGHFKAGMMQIISDNSLDVAKGTLCITSSLSAMIPVADILAPKICSLAATFLESRFGEKRMDMCSVVEKTLNDTLENTKTINYRLD